MSEFIRWLIVLEIIGAAFLPLTIWMLRWLPDRGYGFAKVVGVLFLTYGAWLLGSVVPTGTVIAVPVLILLGAASLGWWFGRDLVLDTVRSRRTVVLLEEALFIAAIAVWSLMRAYYFHPAISHTEQYMDMNFLNASFHSASYPPYDSWMSGRTVNYYYFGYLMYAMLIKLSGVAPTIGYNLGVSTVFAFTLSGAYSVGYALTRNLKWALLAPLFVCLLGNWHGVIEAFQGHSPSTFFWFWDSSRVVGGAGPDYTINEFPYFSFMLGDLHAHVMALPAALLSVALGCCAVLRLDKLSLARRSPDLFWLLAVAIVVGSLFATNSWDFPTYLLIVGVCIGANAYITDLTSDWWRSGALAILGLALGSVIVFAPFYLHFRSVTHGLGFVSTHAIPLEFLQIFGLFIVIAAMLLALYGFLLQPADDIEEVEAPPLASQDRAAEAGHMSLADPTYLMFGAAALLMLVLGVRFGLWTLILILGFGYAAISMFQRVVATEEPNRADIVALVLLCVGFFVLAITEVVYLRDGFDGTASYRMNTVFKYYYQAWVLLGLAGAYGIYRVWSALRSISAQRIATLAVVVVAVGSLASVYYTIEAPSSAAIGGTVRSLDGMAWLQQQHPGDYNAIRWLSQYAGTNAVEMETTGGGYLSQYARVATFSGVSAVMGWADHEGQWRDDPEIGPRDADSKTVYTTTSLAEAKRILRRYHVRFLFVGDTERAIPGITRAELAKFARFMRVAYRSGQTLIYTW